MNFVVYLIYIKENNNSKADPMYRRICYTCTSRYRHAMINENKKKKKQMFSFYLRTTVNRRTFVGSEGRTNEERV